MEPAQTVSTNGRPPSAVEDPLLHAELERQRATSARQAAVIEMLEEDVAMFRRAVVALTARRARRSPRGHKQRGALLEQRFPLDPNAPAAARASVRAVLRGHVPATVIETAELLTSELVTNSVRHADVPSGPGVVVVVRVVLGRTACRVEVGDPGHPGVVAPRPPDIETSGGMGLNLVQSLSERWGVERGTKDGTRVWAQLPAERNGNGPHRATPAPVPDHRDERAEARNHAAGIRDQIAERRDAELHTGHDPQVRAALEAAAQDRRLAAADRHHAAADRAQARHDRVN